MKLVTLQKAELEVSKIGFGTNAVGGYNLFSNIDEAEGTKMIEEALYQGVTFFDTADVYGFGRSEELLGEVIRNKRNDIVLATKGGIQKLLGANTRINNKPNYIRLAVENSLQRLQTDYIDLYYLHFSDPTTPFSESVGELVRLKEEGKIRAIGISNVNIKQLKEANQHGDIAVLQSPYNMLERTAEKELIPYCMEQNISFIPYGPLAFGILSGKYPKDLQLSQGDWRRGISLFEEDVFKKNYEKVEKLKKFATERSTNMPNLALAWLLAQDGIDVVIPGGKHVEQVRENVKINDFTLLKSDLRTIQSILVGE
ncbi:Predicted oxidoreductase [Bacillus sp. 491mf]|uniref:aldo/keto reductase n=1 Tax=Bacillus sp. 491mf TaxID=1761755 RepID=UPI0008E0D814|nr:aldo/keto reductase [Bacillus sp. 491mf]SFC93602.1 Predicted oxidoreductase [Bacillus sp. 491mf]